MSTTPWRVIGLLVVVLIAVIALVLALGSTARVLAAGGLLRSASGDWRAELSIPAPAARAVRVGQPVQLSLVGDAAGAAALFQGRVEHVGARQDGRNTVSVLLDPLSPDQGGQAALLRSDRPVSARIQLGRERLLDALTGASDSSRP